MNILSKIALGTVLAAAIVSPAAAADATYDFSVVSPNGNNKVFSGYATKNTAVDGNSGNFDNLYVTGYRDNTGTWVDIVGGQQIAGGNAGYAQTTASSGVYYLNALSGIFGSFFKLSGSKNSLNAGGFDFGYSPDANFTAKESSNIAINYKISSLFYPTQYFNSTGTPTDANGGTQNLPTTASVPEIDGSKLGLLAYIAFVMMAAFQLRQRMGSLRGIFGKGAPRAA